MNNFKNIFRQYSMPTVASFVGLFYLITPACGQTLASLESAVLEQPDTIPVFTEYTDYAAIIVSSPIPSLEISSNLGIVANKSEPEYGTYRLIIYPQRQILTIKSVDYVESKIPVPDIGPREVLYFSIKPISSTGTNDGFIETQPSFSLDGLDDEVEAYPEKLEKMTNAYNEVVKFEEMPEKNATLKQLAWGRFLKAFESELSFTSEDNMYRQKARERQQFWRVEMMVGEFDTAVARMRNDSISVVERVTMWDDFLYTFAENQTFYSKDDELRAKAKGYQDFWQMVTNLNFSDDEIVAKVNSLSSPETILEGMAFFEEFRNNMTLIRASLTTAVIAKHDEQFIKAGSLFESDEVTSYFSELTLAGIDAEIANGTPNDKLLADLFTSAADRPPYARIFVLSAVLQTEHFEFRPKLEFFDRFLKVYYSDFDQADFTIHYEMILEMVKLVAPGLSAQLSVNSAKERRKQIAKAIDTDFFNGFLYLAAFRDYPGRDDSDFKNLLYKYIQTYYDLQEDEGGVRITLGIVQQWFREISLQTTG